MTLPALKAGMSAELTSSVDTFVPLDECCVEASRSLSWTQWHGRRVSILPRPWWQRARA